MYPARTVDILEALKHNSYPGRGIVMGSAPGGEAVIAYFIMGRSENSRNRVFLSEGDALRIEPFDVSLVSDPALIIYHPIRTLKGQIVVTNGDQTDTVCDYLRRGLSFEDALQTRAYEPDGPAFTPRISGIMSFGGTGLKYTLSILKKQDEASDVCARQFFRYSGVAGAGHILHTYEGDGSPLPSFAGEPGRVLIPDDIERFAGELWQSLNQDNRVALSVRAVSPSGTVREYLFNRHRPEEMKK